MTKQVGGWEEKAEFGRVCFAPSKARVAKNGGATIVLDTSRESGCDGDVSANLIAKGKLDLLYRMIFELRSGISS